MLRTRSRLVNFRLTEVEYDKVQTALVSQGVRCLSDFARDAVLRHASREDASGNGTEVPALSRRVIELEEVVRRVEQSLAALHARVGEGNA
jgi:hypothetical protein